MELTEVHQLVDIAAARGRLDQGTITEVLASVRRLRAWTESVEVDMVRQLKDLNALPQAHIATGGRVSLGHADRIVDRASTARQVPEFNQLLADGKVSGEHIDILGRGMRQLSDDGRRRLIEQTDFLTSVAQRETPGQFDRFLRNQVRRIENQLGTGDDSLRQQRRQARLRTWTDMASGMWCMSGQFDPVTGQIIEARLGKVADSLQHAGPNPDSPLDARDNASFMRAQAMAALIEHGPDAGLAPRTGGSTRWRTDIIHVVHRNASQPAPTNRREFRQQLADGDIIPAVDAPPTAQIVALVDDPATRIVDVHLDGARVLSAPGPLNLDRDARNASPLQRAILNVWYPSCAIPGCEVSFANTHIHHIVWWFKNGLTNLDNLLPLCSHHHHQVHDDNWQLHLDPDRVLTVTLPDGQRLRGTISTSGP